MTLMEDLKKLANGYRYWLNDVRIVKKESTLRVSERISKQQCNRQSHLRRELIAEHLAFRTDRVLYYFRKTLKGNTKNGLMGEVVRSMDGILAPILPDNAQNNKIIS